MRYAIVLCALAALAGAKPGPNTAIRLERAPDFFTVAIGEIDRCPPGFVLKLSRPMPTPNWTLKVDEVKRTEDGRIVIKITAIAPDGAQSQVMTPTTATAKLGTLRRGPHLIDIWYRVGGQQYRRVQAFLLNGKSYRDR